jgi:hypothetical protein
MIALLGHSLANLRRKTAALALEKALPHRERSYGPWNALVAARLQEAELLVNAYIQRPDAATAGDPDHQLGGWAFHR